jgi:hypothetical protein
MHDSPDELAQPGGVVRDWKHGQCDPVPGVTMPRLITAERDYAAVVEKMAALGQLAESILALSGIPTARSPCRAGGRWRSTPASISPTWPGSGRASGSC